MGKQKTYCLLFHEDLDLIMVPQKAGCFNFETTDEGEFCDVYIEDQDYHCKILKKVSCPDQRLIDYMHCCILGTTKYTINLLVDTSKSNEPYYLGNSHTKINDLLQKNSVPKRLSKITKKI